MNFILSIDQVQENDTISIGGKGYSLARMSQSNMNVPDALFISTEAYDEYLEVTGLRERIAMEINRKDFSDMRWEEIWDASLRIRNMFLTTPMPAKLHDSLKNTLEPMFAGRSVVIRSSAPEEDTKKSSFAGLHESFVNIKGIDSVLNHIKLVWASLWSDAALLYRQELSLDIDKSSMAVIIQELIYGEKSGVVFGINPNDDTQSVIEAVYGLNQGFVDGTVEPDRWILDRVTGKIIKHAPVNRKNSIIPSEDGVRLVNLDDLKATTPPLRSDEVKSIFKLALKAENLFGTPQDVEWTWKEKTLYILQSRPITTSSAETEGDKRSWYLSLHRSFENLTGLRKRIEEILIPEMVKDTDTMAVKNIDVLTESEITEEILLRSATYQKWLNVYWSDFIPFAHAIRLFGKTYNDLLMPQDPFEFMRLLGATDMEALERNRMLEEMASIIRQNPGLSEALRNNDVSHEKFGKVLDQFMKKFGDLTYGSTQSSQGTAPILKIVLEMASHLSKNRTFRVLEKEGLRDQYLSSFHGEQRSYALELLDLARISYRTRDNDNIYLGAIKAQLRRAIDEYKRRFSSVQDSIIMNPLLERAFEIIKEGRPDNLKFGSEEKQKSNFDLRVRQIVGQPAGPGIAQGIARVIHNESEIFSFKSGEILVCDAIDPTMTFIVPLSIGIIERRGGMLIHGAIIAREYGLPCVTGVPDATIVIHTGDKVTVDGYLGIVIIG